MKILHVTHSDKGGAGIAAVRLHEALLKTGVESKLLTFHRYTEKTPEHYLFSERDVSRFSLFVTVKSAINRVLKRLRLRGSYYGRFRKHHTEGKVADGQMINFTISNNRLERHPLVREADIIHLHWVCGGVLDFKQFFSRVSKKVVWTLHDMNPFTGGCHYAYDCKGYRNTCQTCPQLEGARNASITSDMLTDKVEALDSFGGELSIVTPSVWLMECSKKSTLFNKQKHQSIYNVVESSECFIEDKAGCREKLSIPGDKKVMLFIASPSDLRKGGRMMLDAFKLMNQGDAVLCMVGGIYEELNHHASVIQLGYIVDKVKMREVYNAVDVFVLPTMADNFPNTVVESLRCGTPVVAFDVGGVSEQISPENGLLIETRDARSLADGLNHFFDQQTTYDPQLIADEAARVYSVDRIMSQHMALYSSLGGNA